jgi:hypothetical protein
MRNPKYFVIDIGTHKLEELKVLFLPSLPELASLLLWSLKQVVKSLLALEFAPLTNVWETIRMYLRPRNRAAFQDIKFICVEPNINICQPNLHAFQQEFDVDYYPIAILGHNHTESLGIIDLNCYDNSLSSSIYSKKNLSVAHTRSCLSLTFTVFFDLLKKSLEIAPQDLIILRINCEGAELGIVRAIRDSGLKVHVICGSLADVRKIHGEEEYKEMLEILSNLGIPYHYFVGSNPFTWLNAFSSPNLSKLIFKS